MKRDDVLARLEMLNQAVAQSLAQHNALLGRIEETRFILAEIEAAEKKEAESLAA